MHTSLEHINSIHHDCSDKNIYSLPSLSRYQYLITFNCSSNQLTELPWDVGSLSALQTLNCSRNAITILPSSIGGLTSLTTLDCSYNGLRHLPDSIGHLHRLHHLDCSNNAIMTFPHSIERLTYLKHLHLLQNPIGCMNGLYLPTLQQLTSLQGDLLSTRMIHESGHVSIPKYFYNLQTIVTSMQPCMDCDNDDFQENSYENHDAASMYCLDDPALYRMIESVKYCQALYSLTICDYNIDALPVNIGLIGSLTSLSCQSNNMTSLPCTIGMLTKLKILHVHDNQLTNLPCTIGCLTALTELNAQSNRLKQLPNEIYGLTTLETLMLCDNKIEFLHPKFVMLDSLETFTFMNNPIRLPINVERFINLIPSINQSIEQDLCFSTERLHPSLIRSGLAILACNEPGNETCNEPGNETCNEPEPGHDQICTTNPAIIIMTPNKFLALMQSIFTDEDIWDVTKTTIEQFCNDVSIETHLFITYQEMLAWTWMTIQNHPDSVRVKHRLNYLTAMASRKERHGSKSIVTRIVSLVASLDDSFNSFLMIETIWKTLKTNVKSTSNEILFDEIKKHVCPANHTEKVLMEYYIEYCSMH